MVQIALETREITQLSQYSQNSKKHTADNVALIAASIERFGFNDPIGIDEDGIIIEGHGRYDAAVSLNMETVPVIVLSGLTDEQKRMYRIAHNKIAQSSTFDFAKLAEAMNDLIGDDISAQHLGFSEAIATNLLNVVYGDAPDLPVLTPVEPYEVVWEDQEQKKKWESFFKRLKQRYPNMSDAAVLTEFLTTCGILEGERKNTETDTTSETINV